MKPYRNFEAFVLQSFIQSMLPHDAQGVFGQGTAGEMWKGLLAEQLGKQLARAGGIGIAKQIYKSHPMDAGTASGLALPLARLLPASGATQLPALDGAGTALSDIAVTRTR